MWHQLSKPCWTHTTIGTIVVMLMNASGLLQMSSQKWNTLEDSNKCIHACTIVLVQEWYYSPYVWTYYISINHFPHCLPFTFFLIDFLKRPSQSLHLISMSVFDILQVPSGCTHICSDSTVPICTLLATGLLLNSPPPPTFKKNCTAYLN
jgi:hypothetical protein